MDEWLRYVRNVHLGSLISASISPHPPLDALLIKPVNELQSVAAIDRSSDPHECVFKLLGKQHFPK